MARSCEQALAIGLPAVAFHYLENDGVVSIKRDPKDLLEAEAIVQEVAGSVRAGLFPAKPGFLCKFCDYRLICPGHERTTAAADASEDE